MQQSTRPHIFCVGISVSLCFLLTVAQSAWSLPQRVDVQCVNAEEGEEDESMDASGEEEDGGGSSSGGSDGGEDGKEEDEGGGSEGGGDGGSSKKGQAKHKAQKKAAAAMAVGIGSFSDPPHMQVWCKPHW